jgi:hypothetical protein
MMHMVPFIYGLPAKGNMFTLILLCICKKCIGIGKKLCVKDKAPDAERLNYLIAQELSKAMQNY